MSFDLNYKAIYQIREAKVSTDCLSNLKVRYYGANATSLKNQRIAGAAK